MFSADRAGGWGGVGGTELSSCTKETKCLCCCRHTASEARFGEEGGLKSEEQCFYLSEASCALKGPVLLMVSVRALMCVLSQILKGTFLLEQ